MGPKHGLDMRTPAALLTVAVALSLAGCNSNKTSCVGTWISKETRVDKGIISSDRTDVIVRKLTLNSDGTGSLHNTLNNRVTQNAEGKWSLAGDILLLDYDNGQTIYVRLLRVSNERLVIRNPDGSERIYDRLK